MLKSCSAGGGIVLLYASKYPDVRTVVNMSGRYDLKTGVAERLGEDFMERIKKDGYIDVKCEKTGGSLLNSLLLIVLTTFLCHHFILSVCSLELFLACLHFSMENHDSVLFDI